MTLWLLRLLWDWLLGFLWPDDDSWQSAFAVDEQLLRTTSPTPDQEAEVCAEPPFF